MPPIFDSTKCKRCKQCVENCPGYVLTMAKESPKVSFPDECWHCGCCRVACKFDAIKFKFPLHTRL